MERERIASTIGVFDLVADLNVGIAIRGSGNVNELRLLHLQQLHTAFVVKVEEVHDGFALGLLLLNAKITEQLEECNKYWKDSKLYRSMTSGVKWGSCLRGLSLSHMAWMIICESSMAAMAGLSPTTK